MRKHIWQKTGAALLAAAMLVSLSGCADEAAPGEASSAQPPAGSSAAAEPSAPDEVVTLTGFVSFAQQTDISKAKWYTDILREKVGVELDFQSAVGVDGNQIMQAMLASGELLDIVGFKDPSLAANAAAAGLLLNLDEHREQLPSVYEGDFFTAATEFSRDTFQSKDGGLCLLPTNVGLNNSINYDPQLRWDVYEKAGKPEIKTLEDYIPALKKMMEVYPETPDGQKVYGMSIFGEWDSTNMGMIAYISAFYGYDTEYVSHLLETKSDGSELPRSILEDDSMYKRVLKFLYDANQAGVMDPDSLTQKWDTVSTKYTEGRILFSPWTWAVGGYNTLEHMDADDFSGYASVWADDFKVRTIADSPVGRVDWTLGIGNATKQADAALRYLNFLYSGEGVDLTMNGPEGALWQTGDDGLRYITEEGWNILDNSLELPGGGKLSDGASIINTYSITGDTPNPAANNQPYSYTIWDSTLLHSKNKLITDWRSYNDNAVNMFQKAQKDGRLTKAASAELMIEVPSDDLQLLIGQIGDVVKTNSWKMAFAKDEAEFESLWTDMKQQADGLGMSQVVDWTVEGYKTAQEKAAKYQ